MGISIDSDIRYTDLAAPFTDADGAPRPEVTARVEELAELVDQLDDAATRFYVQLQQLGVDVADMPRWAIEIDPKSARGMVWPAPQELMASLHQTLREGHVPGPCATPDCGRERAVGLLYCGPSCALEDLRG